jgi:hypothetical protein
VRAIGSGGAVTVTVIVVVVVAGGDTSTLVGTVGGMSIIVRTDMPSIHGCARAQTFRRAVPPRPETKSMRRLLETQPAR